MPAPAVSLARGLVLACHPLPTVAVTAFATAFAAAVGLPAGRVALVALAVLLGQLSIGWGNDWVDAPRDAAAGPRGKTAPPRLGPPPRAGRRRRRCARRLRGGVPDPGRPGGRGARADGSGRLGVRPVAQADGGQL